MVDVMDNLTMERKEIPVYARNLYKWTPEPTILKRDICWDSLTIEDLECPFCRKDNAVDLFKNGDFFIYINPEGYLYFKDDIGIGRTGIVFCPMCGRSLK